MTNSLDGRVAIVTGAGSLPGRGIGRGIVQSLCDKGASVLCADKDEATAEDTAAEMRKAGHSAKSFRADVTLKEDVAAMVREGERYLGRRYDARFEWGPQRLYCSELVYLVYERALGRSLVEPQTFGELVLTDAARRLARRRLGRLPRSTERVVTPVALARSEALFTP